MGQSETKGSDSESAVAQGDIVAEAVETQRPMSLVHRCWFLSVVAFGLIFLFVLPPFQGADEYKHWLRAWSVAEGDVRCGEVSDAAVDARHHFGILRRRDAQITLAKLDLALRQEARLTYTDEYSKAACRYPPFAYVASAVVLRTIVYADGMVHRGDMIKAFYAGRVVNWLCMCLAMYWFILAMPALRNVGLFFLSIPEVLEQTSQYNTDLAQFVCMLVLLGVVLRVPTRRRVVTIGVLAVLLALMKPVYGFIGFLALPGLLELYARNGGSRRRYVIAGAALLLLPLFLWKLWVSANVTPAIFPEGVVPGEQASFLLHNPLHVFKVMWHQLVSLFGHNPMRGAWTSILGGFGPARVELPMAACYALLVGGACSIYADLTFAGSQQAITPESCKTRWGRLSWILAVGSVALVLPLVVLAMYMYYTPVGATRAYGVQGRYYLVAIFMLLVFAIRHARSRWPRLQQGSAIHLLPWLGGHLRLHWRGVAIAIAVTTCVWADLVAVRAVGKYYWFMG